MKPKSARQAILAYQNSALSGKFLFWIPGGSPWIPGPAKAGDGRTSKRARDQETSRGPWNSRKSTPKNPSSARPAGVGRTPKKGGDQSNYSGDPMICIDSMESKSKSPKNPNRDREFSFSSQQQQQQQQQQQHNNNTTTRTQLN